MTRRSQTIGVLGSEISQYGPANTLLGVQQAAREAGYFVSIAALKEVSADSISDAVRHFMDQGVDGIVALVPHAGTLRHMEALNLDLPVVVAGASESGRFSGAMVNQKLGARLAVAHLLEQGHKRICHVSGPQDWIDGAARAEGWREALTEAGLEDDLIVEGDWSAGSGYDIGCKLALKGSATAIFVGNDQMALGLLRAFGEAGVRVPEDVSVVGFDDQPEAAYFMPPLTTIRQDFEELGRRCMDLLLALLKDDAGADTTIVDPRIVVRESTAPVANG